ncbi:glutathione S-transferase T3-like [Zingiber officinale]|uniref:glutathione S-transferase T3-like n=1 Tax=Zingiber officinale TaxID=94328 RepID=UPI001C4DB111|nr:glutathione S-transferase T3-like [Zingiber officinale]
MPLTSSMENEPFTSTFVPNTQLSDRESLIELVNLEKADFGTADRRKRSTWSKVEDEVLARSFVTIIDDPIIGNDQKVDALWRHIASYYNENRSQGTPSRIASIIRFGHSDEDILQLAYEKYHEENNDIACNLEHVWRIINDRPMFTLQSSDHLVGIKKAKTSQSGASNTSSNQDASLHVDLNEEETHPMGQKIAKRKGKGKMKSDIEGMTTNLDNMYAKFTEYTSIKMVEVEMKQKQLKVEEIKAKTVLAKVQLKEYVGS